MVGRKKKQEKRQRIQFRPGVFAVVGERHFAADQWWVFTEKGWRAEKGRRKPPLELQNPPIKGKGIFEPDRQGFDQT